MGPSPKCARCHGFLYELNPDPALNVAPFIPCRDCRVQESIGSVGAGYPCPKDQTPLQLMDGGAWCPECKTVWREFGEVDLADLDALPETEA